MSKETRIEELMQTYMHARLESVSGTRETRMLARSEMRKLEKVFEKEMHEPIGKYLEIEKK